MPAPVPGVPWAGGPPSPSTGVRAVTESMRVELAGKEEVDARQGGVYARFPNPGTNATASEGGVGRALPLCQTPLQNRAPIISCDPHSSIAE